MEKISIEKLEDLQENAVVVVKGNGFCDIDKHGNANWIEFGTFYNKLWQENCYYVKQKKFTEVDGQQEGGVGVTLLTQKEFMEIILKGVNKNV